MNTTQAPVSIGPCQCPGMPHEEDIVELRLKLGLAAGTQLQRLIVEANQNRSDNAELTGKLAEAYLLVGVVGWNLVTEAGPTPVTPETIRTQLLDDFSRSAELADKADSLYMGPVLSPLVRRAATSSRTSSTTASTSAKPAGPSKARKRSKRSSTSTTQTVATATTSG